MAITYTQDDLDALKEALLTGASEVRIGDRVIRYRNQSELIQLIKAVSAYLEGASASSVSTSIIQATFRKGQSS